MATYKITAKDTLVTGLITLIAVYITYYLEYKDMFLALIFARETQYTSYYFTANTLPLSLSHFEHKVPSAEHTEAKSNGTWLLKVFKLRIS